MDKPDIKGRYKKRDKLFLLSRKYPTMENKEKYKQYKNRNLSDQAELNYYTEQFELNKKDIRKSWQIIKSMIGKDNSECSKYKIFVSN